MMSTEPLALWEHRLIQFMKTLENTGMDSNTIIARGYEFALECAHTAERSRSEVVQMEHAAALLARVSGSIKR